MKIRFLSAFLALVMTVVPISALGDDENISVSDAEHTVISNNDISENLLVIDSEQKIQELIKNALVGYADHNSVLSCGKKVSESIGPILHTDNGYYFPVRAVAAYIGGRCEWRPESGSVHIRYGDYTIQIFVGNTRYTVNGMPFEAPEAPVKEGDYVYLHADSIAYMFDKNVYSDESLVVISDENIRFDVETENTMQFKLLSELMFERPDRNKLWEDFRKTVEEKEHPRVIINQERIDTVLERAKTNEQYKTWIDRTVSSAEGMLSLPVSEYAIVGGRILELSRTVMNRFKTLGMAYLLTKDQRFADRAWLEMEKIETYPSWNENHFLDIGEMSAAFAYAYDWMYDGFTEEQRARIRKMASVNAIYHALIAYRGTGPKLPSTRYGWTTYANNWNPVCNGGLAMMCVAMLDEPDMKNDALECIESGLKYLELNMEQFYPNGVFYESNGYFVYNMNYLAPYLSTLDTAFGTNYGFINSPGLVDSFYCRMYYDASVGMFSYGDGDERKYDYPEWAYFAKASNDSKLMKRRMDILKNGGGSLNEILWFDETLAGASAGDTLSLDACFDGTAQVGIIRNSWDDSQGLYLATRAGYGKVPHSHVDVSSFYTEALGQKWTADSGMGDYEWPDYFGDKRYDYYRTRAEGHNMVVMNPDETGGFDMESTTDMELISKEKGAYMVMDMTDGYKPYGAKSAKRAMGLIDDRTRFIVQDEISAEKESEYYWFMHTTADIEISDDGKTAILTLAGRHLLCELISEDGVFSVMDSLPLEKSPVYAPQTFPESHKLTVHIENAKDANISVVMTPYMDGEPVPYYNGEFKKISEWEIADGEIPRLTSMELDGEAFSEFNSNTAVYNIGYYEESAVAPVISASSENYDVSIEQATAIPGNAKIHLSKNGEIQKTINVNFVIREVLGQINGKHKYFPIYVGASDIPEAENNPDNLIDNDIATKWASQGMQYATFDLGEAKKIDTVSVAWHLPAVRITPVNIYVSNDQKEWKLVYSGRSFGIQTEFENYGFDEETAQFVKVEVSGNNMTPWNSIYEIGIYGKSN